MAIGATVVDLPAKYINSLPLASLLVTAGLHVSVRVLYTKLNYFTGEVTQ